MARERPRIISDPDILGGKPTVRGTRISVEFILEELAGGTSVEELLADLPSLTRDDVLAALATQGRVR